MTNNVMKIISIVMIVICIALILITSIFFGMNLRDKNWGFLFLDIGIILLNFFNIHMFLDILKRTKED